MHGDLGRGRVLAARQELGIEEVIVDVLANKNHLALTGLVGFKRLVTGSKVDLLVHALEHKLGVTCSSTICDGRMC